MRQKRPATQDEIPTLMREGWILKRGNFSGHWWLESPTDGVRKVHRASAQALLRRGTIRRMTKDFHRGDTFVLVRR